MTWIESHAEDKITLFVLFDFHCSFGTLRDTKQGKSRLSYFWIYSFVGFPSRLPTCIMHASVWIALTQVDSYNFLLIVMEQSYLMVLSSSYKMPIDVVDITLNNWCDVYHFLVYPHSTAQNIKQEWLFSMKAIPFEILTLSSEFNTVCYAPVSVEMITSQMELIQ